MRKYKGLRASRKKREKLSYVLLFVVFPLGDHSISSLCLSPGVIPRGKVQGKFQLVLFIDGISIFLGMRKYKGFPVLFIDREN